MKGRDVILKFLGRSRLAGKTLRGAALEAYGECFAGQAPACRLRLRVQLLDQRGAAVEKAGGNGKRRLACASWRLVSPFRRGENKPGGRKLVRKTQATGREIEVCYGLRWAPQPCNQERPAGLEKPVAH